VDESIERRSMSEVDGGRGLVFVIRHFSHQAEDSGVMTGQSGDGQSS
jgi:hypothetical protein